MDQIYAAQEECSSVALTMSEIEEGKEISFGLYQKVRSQLVVENGISCCSVKLPLYGLVSVPVIPDVLQVQVVNVAHVNSGHASWQVMHDLLWARCYFPRMAASCQEHVQQCKHFACRKTSHEDQQRSRHVLTSLAVPVVR